MIETNAKKITMRLEKEGLVSVRGAHHKFRKGPIVLVVPHPKKHLPTGNRAGNRQNRTLALKTAYKTL